MCDKIASRAFVIQFFASRVSCTAPSSIFSFADLCRRLRRNSSHYHSRYWRGDGSCSFIAGRGREYSRLEVPQREFTSRQSLCVSTHSFVAVVLPPLFRPAHFHLLRFARARNFRPVAFWWGLRVFRVRVCFWSTRVKRAGAAHRLVA